jgi:hypothetical protein
LEINNREIFYIAKNKEDENKKSYNLFLNDKEFLDIKESLLKMIPPEQRSLVLLQQGGVSKRKTTKKKTSKKKTSKKKTSKK